MDTWNDRTKRDQNRKRCCLKRKPEQCHIPVRGEETCGGPGNYRVGGCLKQKYLLYCKMYHRYLSSAGATVTGDTGVNYENITCFSRIEKEPDWICECSSIKRPRCTFLSSLFLFHDQRFSHHLSLSALLSYHLLSIEMILKTV